MEECSEFLLHVTVVAKTLTTVNASKTVDFWTNEILKGCKIASYHDKSDPVYTAAKILCAAEEADVASLIFTLNFFSFFFEKYFE